jgi:hypothetical protein
MRLLNRRQRRALASQLRVFPLRPQAERVGLFWHNRTNICPGRTTHRALIAILAGMFLHGFALGIFIGTSCAFVILAILRNSRDN